MIPRSRSEAIVLWTIEGLPRGSSLQELARDKKVTGYIARDFPTWLEKQQSIGDDHIEVGKSYVIEKNGKYIGIVGSLEFSRDGILEVWYTIRKNMREKGYGEKILAEITLHLIEHVDGLNDIKLKIDESNKASRKVAERNGYIEEPSEKENGVRSYYYFGHDYFDVRGYYSALTNRYQFIC